MISFQISGLSFFIYPWPFFNKFIFMLQISEIVSEKARGLKLYLTISGFPTLVHLSSWTILNAVLSLYMSLMLFICGHLSGFHIFRKTPAILWISFFFTTSFAINSMCLLINSIAQKNKTGLTFAYSFLMFGFIFQVFMTNPNSVNIIYHQHWFLQYFRKVIEFYPGYNFAKIYSDIVFFSGTIFSVQFGRYVTGTGLEYHQIWEGYHKVTGLSGLLIPSIWDSFKLLFRNIFIIYLLTIFFELTLASNQGVSRNPVIVLFNKISTYISKIRNNKRAVNIPGKQHPSVISEDEYIENILKKDDKLFKEHIIIDQISKDYEYFFCDRKKHQKALNTVKFSIKKGELLAILGENGAGKTTLINILTGCIEPSEGNAYILGMDLKKDLASIHKTISLCPQTDIYWEELTVYEHLWLFSLLKTRQNSTIPNRRILELLKMVELTEKSNEPIKNLSGGMRRRLAIAISIIGDPQIIIFDEPTVGLDPMKRDKILQIIKKLKEDKIIILTTHSMEEADLLSDRIAFLKRGKLKCISNSFALKDEFAEDFCVTLILRKATDFEEVVDCLRKKNQCFKVKSVFDRKVDFEVPKEQFASILGIIKSLVGKDEPLRSLIEDWGFANAGLENVFEKLNRED